MRLGHLGWPWLEQIQPAVLRAEIVRQQQCADQRHGADCAWPMVQVHGDDEEHGKQGLRRRCLQRPREEKQGQESLDTIHDVREKGGRALILYHVPCLVVDQELATLGMYIHTLLPSVTL